MRGVSHPISCPVCWFSRFVSWYSILRATGTQKDATYMCNEPGSEASQGPHSCKALTRKKHVLWTKEQARVFRAKMCDQATARSRKDRRPKDKKT
eukprot:6207972-Pleurochrysis_carterae.AAC.3